MDEHRSGLLQEEDAGDLLKIRGGGLGRRQVPDARLSEVPLQTLATALAAFEPAVQLFREQPEQQMRPELAQQS